MSPARIKELVKAAEMGNTEVLRVIDFAVEQMIFEGSDNDLEQAVQIIGNFLSDAIIPLDIPNAA